MTREAYSHEVSSAGFWPGGGGIDYPAFYSYAYPTPDAFAKAPVRPEAAFFHEALGEFILPYDAVREADDAPLRLGALGLVVGGAAGAWYEFVRLSGALRERLGTRLHAAGSVRRRLLLPAAGAAGVGLVGRFVAFDWPRLVGGPLVVGAMGLAYLLLALRTGVPEAGTATRLAERVVPVRDIVEIQRGQRRRRRRR